MTKGDIKWIENWKPKGVKMKSTKRTIAHTKNPIVGKLLRLKYKINEAYSYKITNNWIKTYPIETLKKLSIVKSGDWLAR